MELQSFFIWSSLLGIFAFLLHKLTSRNKDYWHKQGIKVVRLDNFFIRVFVKQSSFLQQDEMLYKQIQTEPYAGYLEMTNPVLLLKDLDVIKQVCVKDFDHFINRRNFNAQDPHWNNMLFNQSDQSWKDLRSSMSPTFTTGKIRRMYSILNQCSKRLFSHLKKATVDNNGIVNLEDVLGKYAMDVISCAAFGIESGVFEDPNSTVATMAKKFQLKFNPLVILRFFFSMAAPAIGKALHMRVLDREADEYFTKLIKDSIQYRERSGEKRNDFLQLMIETKNGGLQSEKDAEELDTYEKDALLSPDKRKKIDIDDDVIVANCILFIFGGFDTTQSALIYTAYCLALNPEVQETLRREVDDSTENNGKELNYDMINNMAYLDKVISESLRMYPPAVRTERRCTKDYTLPNSKSVVRKGSLVGMPIFQIHHDPNNFPNPEVFDPERFSPEVKSQRHPYAYMPFGHGPRNCIANRFALAEMKTAIANLVLNFEIEPCSKTPIPMKFINTTSLKPVGGMWLKLNPRK